MSLAADARRMLSEPLQLLAAGVLADETDDVHRADLNRAAQHVHCAITALERITGDTAAASLIMPTLPQRTPAPTCLHCGKPAWNYLDDQPYCWDPEEVDCYELVNIHGHSTPCRRCAPDLPASNVISLPPRPPAA